MNENIDEKYLKQPHEFDDDYLLRIYSYKKSDKLRWCEITQILNAELHDNKDESTYRKRITKLLSELEEENTKTVEEEIHETQDNDLVDILNKIKLERYKLSDERTQNNAYLRLQARKDTIREIAEDVAKIVGARKHLLTKDGIEDRFITSCFRNPIGILCISDWHYGMCCDNWLNTYDTEKAKERIAKLKSDVLFYRNVYGFNTLYLCNLGDLIAGRIHTTVRIENRIDVITQTIEVSEILAEFIADLVKEGLTVKYSQCSDNHSRIEPDKAKSLDLESLTRITYWYLQQRFENISEVEFLDNLYDDDIITLNVNNYKIAGVHGHHDKPNNVVEQISILTEKKYDLILTAHLHHFSADERLNTIVLGNGSLCGVDTYAKNLRVASEPTQNLIVCTEDCITKGIHRLELSTKHI